MPNTYFTSDEHYMHAAINRLAERPFASTEECKATMIARHNKVVRPEDRTFHLGDFWFGPRDDGAMAEVLAALNGEHVLIAGNHDRCSNTQTNGWQHQRAYLDAGFAAVVDSATITLPEVSRKKVEGGAQQRKVLMSHFPYAGDHTEGDRHTQFRLRDRGAWLIHGHVHGLYTVRNRGVNVGVDRFDFKPVNIHDVALLIAQVEAGTRAED